MLREAGLDMGHEATKEAGSCSGFHHTQAPWYPIPITPPDQLHPQVVGWLMRHPLTSVPSLAAFLDGRSRFLRWYAAIGFPVVDEVEPVRAGLAVWLETHKRIERQIPQDGLVLELERLPGHWPQIQDRLGIEAPLPHIEPPGVTKPGRRRRPAAWSDLEEVAPEWAQEARAIHRRFRRMARQQRGS